MGERDELGELINDLFISVSAMIKGELQPSADSLGIGSGSDNASDPCNVDSKNFSTVVTNEFPSFDLGF